MKRKCRINYGVIATPKHYADVCTAHQLTDETWKAQAKCVDAAQAEEIVRCAAHKQVPLQAARESIILLKNEGVLPLKKNEIKKIALFGPSVDELPLGENPQECGKASQIKPFYDYDIESVWYRNAV